jgi:hypothetical protein
MTCVSIGHSNDTVVSGNYMNCDAGTTSVSANAARTSVLWNRYPSGVTGTFINASNSTLRYEFDATGALTAQIPGSLSAAGNVSAGAMVLPGRYAYADLPSCTASLTGAVLYCRDCKNATDDATGTFDSAAAKGGHGTYAVCENEAAPAWRVH